MVPLYRTYVQVFCRKGYMRLLQWSDFVGLSQRLDDSLYIKNTICEKVVDFFKLVSYNTKGGLLREIRTNKQQEGNNGCFRCTLR